MFVIRSSVAWFRCRFGIPHTDGWAENQRGIVTHRIVGSRLLRYPFPINLFVTSLHDASVRIWLHR